MIIKKIRFLPLFIGAFFMLNFSLSALISVPSPDIVDIPRFKAFQKNINFSRDLDYRKITVAEYITDPIILYASLWGCIGLTTLLWEKDLDYEPNPVSVIDSGYTWLYRIQVQPFSNDQTDLILKPWPNAENYVLSVFKGNFYAKNIIEPIYFTYLALYLRAKNYHPGIVIAEIITLALLYEFTVRPIFLNLSFEQLIKNPCFAIIIGIFLDEVATFLLTTPFLGLHILAYILNPFKLLPTARIRPLFLFKPYQKTISLEAVIPLDLKK